MAVVSFFKTIASSKEVNQQERKKSKEAYDINIRTPISFREIGRGHSMIQKLCGIMNIPPPMNKSSYESNMEATVHDSYVSAGQESMIEAAKEAVPEKMLVSSDDVKPVTASFDGTWQRGGYAPLNGLVLSVSMFLIHIVIGTINDIKSVQA